MNSTHTNINNKGIQIKVKTLYIKLYLLLLFFGTSCWLRYHCSLFALSLAVYLPAPLRLWALCILRRPLWDLLHDHADSHRRRSLLCHHATSDLHRRAVQTACTINSGGGLALLTGLEPSTFLWLEWGGAHTHTLKAQRLNCCRCFCVLLGWQH